MKADIFSAVMSALQGDREAIRDIARMRAFNALQPRSGMMPEYYPYMLVMEATEMAFQSLSRKALSKRALIPAALRLALEISKAYDDESLMPWLTFCEPAQDMAWRGYGPAHILSAAINTSPHTAVQTTGQLAGYIINVEPASFFDIRGAFSAFADDEINGKVHEKIVDSIFEDILATGLKEKNVDALLKLANKQNEDLTEGRVAGWCASALQAAARAFDMHYEREGEAENAARRKFRDERTHTAWSDLRILGNKVLEQQRQGEIVTLSRVAELSGKDSNLESVRKSIDMTLKDPSFQSRLKAASELSNSVAPRPRGPGLEARPGGPRGPAPQASPALGKTRTITESGQRHQEKEDGKQGAVE